MCRFKCWTPVWSCHLSCSDGFEDWSEAQKITSALLESRSYENLVDFDNHLDDLRNDWTNPVINKSVLDLCWDTWWEETSLTHCCHFSVLLITQHAAKLLNGITMKSQARVPSKGPWGIPRTPEQAETLEGSCLMCSVSMCLPSQGDEVTLYEVFLFFSVI